MKMLSEVHIKTIAQALGDTNDGLTGSEIGELIGSHDFMEIGSTMTKWRRLFNAFADHQNRTQDHQGILDFIKSAMHPARYLEKQERYEILREKLNRALSFIELAVNKKGELIPADKAQTINEAEARARDLRENLISRDVHPDVLKYCRAELLADNYFYAVFEATKSITTKIHALTGLEGDEMSVVNRALCPVEGKPPMLAINNWKTDSEKSEQQGFLNLVKGVFGMFRNPIAHQPRIHWEIGKADAEDLLSLASLIHRRLDTGKLLPRA